MDEKTDNFAAIDINNLNYINQSNKKNLNNIPLLLESKNILYLKNNIYLFFRKEY